MKPTTTLVHETAYAYDMYAIATIKWCYNRFDEKVHQIQLSLNESLIRQHGIEGHNSIIDSDEYERLYTVNEEMYIRINEMKTREATGEDAKYIDDRVYQRFLAKKALQEKFFPYNPLMETKHGYIGQEDKRVSG